MSNRNSNIEFFRFILMLSICVWHTMDHGFFYMNMSSPDIVIPDSRLIIMSLTIPAVDCFIMVSGYYGIKLSCRKVFSFGFQGVATVLACTYWVSQYTAIRYIAPISVELWWFFTCYFIVLLLSPFIEAGFRQLAKRHVILIVTYLLSMICIVKMLDFVPGGRDLLTFLTIYLLGRCLSVYGFSLSRFKSLVMLVLSTILLIALVFLFFHYGNHNNAWMMLSNNNPLVIMQSLGMVYFLLSFKPTHNVFVNFLGKHCFSIYLVTGLLGSAFMYKWWADLWDYNMLTYSVALLGVSFGCMVFDFVQSRISAFLFDRIPILQMVTYVADYIDKRLFLRK